MRGCAANPLGMAAANLDPDVLATLRALRDQRVEFVVIGDAADMLHGTRAGGYVDALTIVPSGFARNIDRLQGLMANLAADLRVPGESQTLPVDLSRLRELGRCTLATDLADVTIDFEPPGTAGYADLYTDSRPVELSGGLAPQVASAADLDRIEDATRSVSPRVSPSAGPAQLRGRAPARQR